MPSKYDVDTMQGEKVDDYAYCPNWKNAHYALARLGPWYHPLEAFEIFENFKRDRSFRYELAPLIGAGFFIFASIFSNLASTKPWFARIHLTAASGVVGFFGGYAALRLRDYRQAQQEAVTKHYIQTHPEDFPPISTSNIK